MSGAPLAPLRISQLCDNLDGTIERGYCGSSVFHWEELPGTLRPLYAAFARLLASVGINAISLPNVNACFDASLLLLSSDFVQKAAALETAFA